MKTQRIKQKSSHCIGCEVIIRVLKFYEKTIVISVQEC